MLSLRGLKKEEEVVHSDENQEATAGFQDGRKTLKSKFILVGALTLVAGVVPFIMSLGSGETEADLSAEIREAIEEQDLARFLELRPTGLTDINDKVVGEIKVRYSSESFQAQLERFALDEEQSVSIGSAIGSGIGALFLGSVGESIGEEAGGLLGNLVAQGVNWLTGGNISTEIVGVNRVWVAGYDLETEELQATIEFDERGNLLLETFAISIFENVDEVELPALISMQFEFDAETLSWNLRDYELNRTGREPEGDELDSFILTEF